MLKLKTGSNTGSDTLTRDPTLPKSLTRKPGSMAYMCISISKKSPTFLAVKWANTVRF